MKRFTASVATIAFSLTTAIPAFAATEPNLACVQQLISTREATVLSAFNVYSTTIQSAYQIRQSGLQSAWGIQDKDQRQDSIRNVWKNFKATVKTAKTTVRNQRKNAWKNFRDSRKNCGGSVNTDPGGGESADTMI